MKEVHMLLVMDYMEDNWDTAKEAQLQQLIGAGELDPKELQAWKQLYQQTGKLPHPLPSQQLSKNFYAMLGSWDIQPKANAWQQFVQKFQQNPTIRLSHFVAGMLLLILGIMVGYGLSPTQRYEAQISSLSQEIQHMRETMVLTLLDQPSATQRLKAVSISTHLSEADATIYNALLKTLNQDPHVNVRLAALQALLHYGQNPLVRQGLVQAIPQQSSPLVQIALAEAMVQLQEVQAVDKLKTLLEQDDLNEVARQTIERSIQTLI